MIRPAIRFAAACVGILLLAVCSGLVLEHGFDLRASLLIAAGFALLIPLFGERVRHEDIRRLTEELRRYRTAMFACFGAALLIYAAVTSRQMSSNALQNRVAALGAAFWLVGLVLMFFVVYYGSRRALALRARDEDRFD